MKNILVVDDSPVVRKFACNLLHELGFKTIQASNGVEAFAACHKQLPDGILLDWNMPEMNGIEFLQKFRHTAQAPHIPIIFCTTENEIPQIEKALSLGADEYIMKPFDHVTLSDKLQYVGLLVSEGD